MAELLYFISNIDDTSPIGALEAPVAGVEPAHRSQAYADLIAQALAYAGVEDPQAEVMAAIYSGNGIPRSAMYEVENTSKAIDVADPLITRLFMLNREHEDSSPFDAEKLDDVVQGIGFSRDNMRCLTESGLVADSTCDNPHDIYAKPLAIEIKGSIDLEPDEEKLVDGLGLSHCGYEVELEWVVNGDSPTPILRTGREHIALGKLSADSSFEHVVTILDTDYYTPPVPAQ